MSITTYYPNETDGLINGQQYHQRYNDAETVDWSTPGLKVTRLRLLTDPGFPVWDVSYCHGELKDGTPVRVELPFSQIPKKGFSKFIVQHAIKDNVYAKGLGILDNISKLW